MLAFKKGKSFVDSHDSDDSGASKRGSWGGSSEDCVLKRMMMESMTPSDPLVRLVIGFV